MEENRRNEYEQWKAFHVSEVRKFVKFATTI